MESEEEIVDLEVDLVMDEKDDKESKIIPMESHFSSECRKYFGYLQINNEAYSKNKIYCEKCHEVGIKKS